MSASFSLLQTDPTTWGTPPLGKTYVGVNDTGQLVLKQNDGTITPIVSGVPAITEYSNASGTTTITAASSNLIAAVTVTGTARGVPLVLDTDGIQDGQQLTVRVDFPEIDSLILRFYNTLASGSPLSIFESAVGTGITNGLWNFYAKDGLWVLLSNQVPAAS